MQPFLHLCMLDIIIPIVEYLHIFHIFLHTQRYPTHHPPPHPPGPNFGYCIPTSEILMTSIKIIVAEREYKNAVLAKVNEMPVTMLSVPLIGLNKVGIT